MSGAFSFAASSAIKIPELDWLLKEAGFGRRMGPATEQDYYPEITGICPPSERYCR
jgi:hypothetical protein